MKNNTAYEELKQALRIDLMRLDESLIEMPQLVHEVAEFAAEATTSRDRAKMEWEIAQAQAARDIRTEFIDSRARFTVDQIANEVQLDETVRECQLKYEDLKHDAANWQALVDAVRTKSSTLKHVAELIVAGYLTPDAIKEQRRDQIHQRRQIRRAE